MGGSSYPEELVNLDTTPIQQRGEHQVDTKRISMNAEQVPSTPEQPASEQPKTPGITDVGTKMGLKPNPAWSKLGVASAPHHVPETGGGWHSSFQTSDNKYIHGLQGQPHAVIVQHLGLGTPGLVDEYNEDAQNGSGHWLKPAFDKGLARVNYNPKGGHLGLEVRDRDHAEAAIKRLAETGLPLYNLIWTDFEYGRDPSWQQGKQLGEYLGNPKSHQMRDIKRRTDMHDPERYSGALQLALDIDGLLKSAGVWGPALGHRDQHEEDEEQYLNKDPGSKMDEWSDHKHDGWPSHPVNVKYHRAYFGRQQGLPGDAEYPKEHPNYKPDQRQAPPSRQMRSKEPKPEPVRPERRINPDKFKRLTDLMDYLSSPPEGERGFAEPGSAKIVQQIRESLVQDPRSGKKLASQLTGYAKSKGYADKGMLLTIAEMLGKI